MNGSRQSKAYTLAAQEYEGLSLPGFKQEHGAPTLVAIEGANGTGKTTLSRALATRLDSRWCLGTDSAWFTDAFKVRMIRDADWFASAFFFLSGCFEQMRLLRDVPERLAIMDRSMWSTLAVHAASAPGRLEKLLAAIRPIADEIRVPDFTLVLEGSYESCEARIATKQGLSLELDKLTARREFHDRERAFYDWLASKLNSVRALATDQLNAAEVETAALSWLTTLAGTNIGRP